VADHGTTRPQDARRWRPPRHPNACRSRVDPNRCEGKKTTGLKAATRAGYSGFAANSDPEFTLGLPIFCAKTAQKQPEQPGK